MANRIEIHNQIKAFYSIVFNGEHLMRPTHISLYMFLLNQNNRNMWVEWFKCPYDLAMQGALINSKTTYYSVLDDLVKFGLIKYEHGTNSFKAPKIRLIPLRVPKNEQLTEQVTVPLSEQVSGQLTVPLTVPLSDNIIILLTDNLKRITDNIEGVIEFLDEKEKEPQIGQAEFDNFIQQFNIIRKSKFTSKTKEAKKHYIARRKEGFTDEQMLSALRNFMSQQYHKDNNFDYLTPEFITRADKLDKGMNLITGTDNEKPKAKFPR